MIQRIPFPEKVKQKEIQGLEPYFKLIKDPAMQQLCRNVYDHTPVGYFLSPGAIYNGNGFIQHPADEVNIAGQIKHIKRATIMAFWAAYDAGF